MAVLFEHISRLSALEGAVHFLFLGTHVFLCILQNIPW